MWESLHKKLPQKPRIRRNEEKHKGGGTYLVSSMLSDEASPELVLELAAGMTRSVVWGPQENTGPRSHILGSSCRAKDEGPSPVPGLC